MWTSARTFTLAYSPCPNDTYIFAALTNDLLPEAPRVRVHLADIEELNSAAVQARYELTKVSYGAIPYLMNDYRILRSGGALGRGCGPLVVTRPGAAATLDDLRGKRIAIPGERTTAYMLLRLALGAAPDAVQMRFDAIIPAVASGAVDAGLIIHESRFTYAAAGLQQVADLGEWWESQSGMPIPLGGILVRNDVSDEDAHEIDRSIQRSLAFSRSHESAVMPYIREHAFEMSDDVMRKHIGLYVNEYSDDLGESGITAVCELFARARDAGILSGTTEPRFV
ncbi:MAG TPA: 1,4-dihydroxy-6-naphthoate synthase [Candidatus Baltobacteraceae bacterium]|jgi:1,4-dihydroxy-6-naphthoate synthase|nr:1,4-dihydroxy-6-naphthoate synthase [Candidatus Baltobacteraceae bacterium]